jgi:hypothetical protein
MALTLNKIKYADLNARQQESYNFSKLSAVLADYGFTTMRLHDDWQGADFIAQHIDGKTFLRVQLKGRLDFREKYRAKDIYIGFRDRVKDEWYLVPHDEVLEQVLSETRVSETVSWKQDGEYNFPTLTRKLLTLLERYKIGGQATERNP